VSATRRLAAILAADVVGYSSLMGRDEAGTARAVRENREAAAPIVRGFGGRVVKTRAMESCWNFRPSSPPSSARSQSSSRWPSAALVFRTPSAFSTASA
jgi:hypothetical protein